jgi:hypothetical protein
MREKMTIQVADQLHFFRVLAFLLEFARLQWGTPDAVLLHRRLTCSKISLFTMFDNIVNFCFISSQCSS